jgi:hypothetical protein
VQGACLAWALNVGDCHGVWGGTTPRERRAMLVAWRSAGADGADGPGVRGPVDIPVPVVAAVAAAPAGAIGRAEPVAGATGRRLGLVPQQCGLRPLEHRQPDRRRTDDDLVQRVAS